MRREEEKRKEEVDGTRRGRKGARRGKDEENRVRRSKMSKKEYE